MRGCSGVSGGFTLTSLRLGVFPSRFKSSILVHYVALPSEGTAQMSNERVKKVAQRLMLSTCLTVGASAVAQAGTVTGPFSNSLASPTVLPPGTTGIGDFLTFSFPLAEDA